MLQVSRIDGNTLSWVKSEIDQTMDNARKALEAYVENPADESQLRFCLNYLHQVYGTLQMVELYGAGMLANELERLSTALIDNKVKNRDEAYEVMMRGMMQLPDYLERLQQGQADYPIVLLPLLNDLRAARGSPLLSESALFSPNLEVDAPIPLEAAEDSIDTLVRKLRHAYHLGLLDWFRDNDVNAGLKRISSVIERLRPAANDPDTGRVLWAASGLVEALRDGGVNSSIAIKLLMGQVDREFKKILDKGEFALSSEPPVELLKNLLYYVASSKSQGSRVTELKNAFNLKELMPDTETLERARADLSAPNAALMRTVSSVLLEDLTQVKDNLDVFVRSENRDPATLTELSNKLGQMSDTLDMLGFGAQRILLQDQVAVLRAMGAGERDIEEPVLMDVAGSLLSIEGALSEPTTHIEAVDDTAELNNDASIIRQFTNPEQRKLVRHVVDEVKVDLNTIKDAFNDYSRAPKHVDALSEVPGLLDRIRGSLSMLTLERASEILSKAAQFIQTRIIDPAVRPDAHTLDLLADSISSVEYYLESLTESWGHPTAILDVAEQSLIDLGVDDDPAEVAAKLEAVDTGDSSDNDQTLVDLSAPDFDLDASAGSADSDLTMELSLEHTQPELVAPDFSEDMELPAENDAIEIENDLPQVEISEQEDMTLSPVVEEDDTAEFNIEALAADLEELSESGLAAAEIAEQEPEEPTEPQVETPAPVPASAPSVTTQPTLADELDDEIVEIFLEEADEEHGNISRLLPHWQNNPQDADTLKNLRRSFHTLKGSGRLVGAADVGEFAWAFENMLNRVIDNTIQPDETMFELLEKARTTLPGLFELFRRGQKPGQEVYTLMEMSEALSKGESVNLSALSQAPATAAEDVAPVEELTIDSTPAGDNTGADSDLGALSDAHSIELQIEGIEMPSSDAPAFDMHDTGYAEIEEEISAQLQAPAEVTVPSIDPVLLGIYRKEIATHLQALREYIDDWRNGIDRSSNHKLVRALHTLKGSSRTASVPQIAELCNFLEDHVKYLQDSDLSVDAELIELFADSANYIEHTVSLLDQENAQIPDNRDLIIRTRALLDQTRHDAPTMQISMPETVADMRVEGIELEETELVPEPGLVSATVIDTGPQESEEEWQPEAADYDEELLEIFLEEGVEILDDSDHTLHDWIASPDNSELVKSLQRQLHTLKGGARMAGVTEIGDLSHSIENMLTAVMDRGLDVTEEMFRAMQKAQDRLVAMLDEIRNSQRPRPATQLINIINALSLGQNVDSATLDEPSAELSQPAVVSDEPAADISQAVTDSGVPSAEIVQPRLDKAPSPDFAPELVGDSVTLPAEAEITLESVEMSEPEMETAPDTTTDFESISITDSVNVEAEAPSETPAVQPEQGQDPFAAFALQPQESVNNVVPLDVAQTPTAAPSPMPEPAEEPKQAQQRARGELIRVRSDLLDNLVNFAGEVSIYRSRMEQQTNAFRYNLTELDDTVSRLRGQLRQFEIEAEAQIQYRIEETGTASVDFDPLEFDRFTQMQTLSRGMLESLNDLDSLRGILTNLTRESETLLLQQSRVNTDLQEGLMRTRMVPISGQIPRLRRIVRQTSEELGKKVELQIFGAENELDRTILERIMSPLEHMLRNAIAHGIERPAVRSQAGKNETGTINLGFAREGSDIVISVADDGAGINLDAIRKKAIQRGILKPDAVVHKDDLIDIILESGFSTAEEVTQIAGRGVGMDVVNSEIKQLGGLLDIKTEQGKGTNFSISMPLSLSVTRALMITASEETYAIPLLGVESVERVSRDEVLRMQNENNGAYRWLEHDYRYINLGAAMGVTENTAVTEDAKKVPILLVRSGEHRAAIHVDGLIGSREIVVKPVGPQLSTLRGIAGATVMGDGSVVLILDLGVLIRLSSIEREEVAAEAEAVEPVVVEKRIPLVMVVDDSITVRKVTTRLLERNNFKTISAKDGVDALAQLQEQRPDVMLLDVEMPRMDGFELATNIRNDQQLKDIPIIMITSRTGQKHRDRAMSIGVNIYMGKPYSEGELLDNIGNLLNQKG
ncbi:MAG: response regulator [Gammaproteobacteria bacterium]|nr:response regulator [Gammaproteobacteria bacterium]